MTIRVKVYWKIMIGSEKKHSGCVDKDVDINTSLDAHWESIKGSIKGKIHVPKHSKLVDSLVLFAQPKKDDVQPLNMSKTFKETFGSDDMPKQLQLYTDYYNPNSSGNSSGRTGKRKRED